MSERPPLGAVEAPLYEGFAMEGAPRANPTSVRHSTQAGQCACFTARPLAAPAHSHATYLRSSPHRCASRSRRQPTSPSPPPTRLRASVRSTLARSSSTLCSSLRCCAWAIHTWFGLVRAPGELTPPRIASDPWRAGATSPRSSASDREAAQRRDEHVARRPLPGRHIRHLAAVASTASLLAAACTTASASAIVTTNAAIAAARDAAARLSSAY